MKTIVLGILILSSLSLTAQSLPPVHGIAVSGRSIKLPEEVKGKIAVLVIGFTRNSSAPTEAWAGRFRADFNQSGDVVVLRLPFLEEVPRIFRGLARSGVAKSAGQDRDRVVPIFESEATFKHLVQYSKPDDAYILVLDRAGTICGVFSGDVATQYSGARERVSRLLLVRSDPPAQ